MPLDKTALTDFDILKKELEKATIHSIDECHLFVVECDAFEVVISVMLNQEGPAVTFMSRILQSSELHYPSVEKEATVITESVHK